MTNPRDTIYEAALIAAQRGDRDASNRLYEAWRATPNTADIAKSATVPSAEEVLLKDAVHSVVVAKAALDALLPKNWSKDETTLMIEAYSSTPEGRALYDLQRSQFGRQPLSKVRTEVNKARGDLAGVEHALRVLQEWTSLVED